MSVRLSLSTCSSGREQHHIGATETGCHHTEGPCGSQCGPSRCLYTQEWRSHHPDHRDLGHPATKSIDD